MSATTFLDGVSLRPVSLPTEFPFQQIGLALGAGASALEVLVLSASATPRAPVVKALWQSRNNGRAAPLLAVVLFNGRAMLCGPAGEEPPIYQTDSGQAERLCREALAQPDRHAAIRLLRDTLPSVETRLPGVRNEGFLATHELEVGARNHPAWHAASQKARGALNQRGESMLTSLGFQIERADQVTSILRTAGAGRKVAVAVLLNQSESPELQTDRYSGLSPVSYALTVAHRENLPYVVVLQGSKIRLYPVRLGVGVARRGPTETFVELHTGLLRDSDAAYLWLLFSAEALDESGTLSQLLEESKRFAGSLAENLRERIYDFVIPPLATGLAKARGSRKSTPDELAVTYEMAMTVLFRLLFIAYGEDKDLLPYKWNSLYQARSLKHKAQELLDLVCRNVPTGRTVSVQCLEPGQLEPLFDEGDSMWEEISRLFVAVADGHREWGIPAYDGGLFSDNPEVSRVGKLLADISLPNKVIGPVLANLLLIGTPEGIGPVDFRSLGVREFGTIYEGLLESELAVAETDLSVDKDGFYRPCRAGEVPVVARRHIYLHNRSGARKSTGAYFTKPFAVEHLLEYALEPALKEHLTRLDSLSDDDAAATTFFDFRVADIAMGSGHFLVAAVDHIERALSQYLSHRMLSGVRHELATLRAAAQEAIGTIEEQIPIEDTQLLRRLVARRCIYGVDLNPVAVNLARLSIWIHTFVPGLPLSLLDHNLVTGNSLVGIGRLREIEDKAQEDELEFFKIDAAKLVGDAAEPLTRLARITDSTAADVRRARRLLADANEAVAPAKALCDVVTSCRITGDHLPATWDLRNWSELSASIVDSRPHRSAKKLIRELEPFHFLIAFPEVFLRDRSGFDVILGNPPWDKVRFEAQQFWVTRCAGLNAVPANKREAAIEKLRRDRPSEADLENREIVARERLQALIDRAYSLQGRGRHGHHDLAKVFTERALNILSPLGSLGYVLPRTALVLGGWADLREVILNRTAVTTLQARNRAGWLFDDVDARLMITLLTRLQTRTTERPGGVCIWPSVESRVELAAANPGNWIHLEQAEIEALSDSWIIPWFSANGDKGVFDQMRTYPRLGSGNGWIHGIADSSRWDFSNSGPHSRFMKEKDSPTAWRVLMTRHVDAYRIVRDGEFQRFIADPTKLVPLELGVTLNRSAPMIGAQHPIIIYRYPTRNDDTRTLIAAALDSKGYLYSKGYVHGLRTNDAGIQEVIALLGYMNSFVCDWWVRRFTDRHMTLPVLSNIPLPAWNDDTRRLVAEIVSTLLTRFGTFRLPGGIELAPSDRFASKSYAELLSLVEKSTLNGFNLDHRDFERICQDFSSGAFKEGFVELIQT